MTKDNMIKVFLPFPTNEFNCKGECVWAEQISLTTARVKNCPIGKDAHGIEYDDVITVKEPTVPTNAEYELANSSTNHDK